MAAYIRYAQSLGFASEIVYDSDSSWSLQIAGDGCWEQFQYESGKHVVQRVPPTESRGRRHTSIVSVAVLNLKLQAEAGLSMDEVEIIAQRGHGKGGQHQNKVSSAIRALHKPTGIRVFINGRDQYQNKRLALQILAARVAEAKRKNITQEHNRAKVEQLGFGTRSGKIRTYNFINGFVIDHRTGRKTHRVADVMKGKFELLR